MFIEFLFYYLFYFLFLIKIAGELGDYDSKIMVDTYVSEFRFIPDQVCMLLLTYIIIFPVVK